MANVDERIPIAAALFKAWSSGDPDAPAQYLTDDAVLYDICSGEFAGWPAIRAFFAKGLEKWDDLVLEPQDYWTSDRGVSLSWVMTATVTDDRFGAEAHGKQWRSEGMSSLTFRGDKVEREVDYHDSGARAKSLGL